MSGHNAYDREQAEKIKKDHFIRVYGDVNFVFSSYYKGTLRYTHTDGAWFEFIPEYRDEVVLLEAPNDWVEDIEAFGEAHG